MGLLWCQISGWPSNGGIVIRPNADSVELAYLGLDRFDPPIERLKDQKSEDDFCKSLLRIGKTWCWVVEYTAPEEGTLPEVAADIGQLRMCFTMEERCEMLRDRFGPTFYEDPKDFYFFRDL